MSVGPGGGQRLGGWAVLGLVKWQGLRVSGTSDIRNPATSPSFDTECSARKRFSQGTVTWGLWRRQHWNCTKKEWTNSCKIYSSHVQTWNYILTWHKTAQLRKLPTKLGSFLTVIVRDVFCWYIWGTLTIFIACKYMNSKWVIDAWSTKALRLKKTHLQRR